MMDTGSILNVWDHCLGEDQIYKGATLASLALNIGEASQILEWSIEKRDTAVFQVRKTLFGNQFHNTALCPNCSQTLEWDFSFQQMGIPTLDDIPSNVEIHLGMGASNFLLRLPNSNDLLTNDEKQIVHNCIVNPDPNGDPILITDELINLVNDQWDENCHTSNIIFQLTCNECEHEWEVNFDIVNYLWKEIDQWAKNFLGQIGMLAKTFGWSEADIINMSQNRRNHYLNLINS